MNPVPARLRIVCALASWVRRQAGVRKDSRSEAHMPMTREQVWHHGRSWGHSWVCDRSSPSKQHLRWIIVGLVVLAPVLVLLGQFGMRGPHQVLHCMGVATVKFKTDKSPFSASYLVGLPPPARPRLANSSKYPVIIQGSDGIGGPVRQNNRDKQNTNFDPRRYCVPHPRAARLGLREPYSVKLDDGHVRERSWEMACATSFEWKHWMPFKWDREGNVVLGKNIMVSDPASDDAALFLYGSHRSLGRYDIPRPDSWDTLAKGGHGNSYLNVWHFLVDDPTIWCAAHFAQRVAKAKGLNPASVTIVDSYRAETLFARLLLRPHFRNVVLAHNRDALRAMNHSRRIYVWRQLKCNKCGFFSSQGNDAHNEDCTRCNILRLKGYEINGNGMPGVMTQDVSPIRRPDRIIVEAVRGMMSGLGIERRECSGGYVLVLDRAGEILPGARKLVSAGAGDLAGVLSAMTSRGLPVVASDLLSVPLRDQLPLFAQAAVMVGVHGAGLTNMIFMRPGSALIEVTIRVRKQPSSTLPRYPFVVFSDTAQFAGLRYYSHDPVDTVPYPPPPEDAHAVRAVVVDAKVLAEQTLRAWSLATCCESPDRGTPLKRRPQNSAFCRAGLAAEDRRSRSWAPSLCRGLAAG